MKRTVSALALLMCSVAAFAVSGDKTATYTASAKFAASSTTDNFVIPGNASNTVYVTEIRLTCSQTTAGVVTVNLSKHSGADTAGTPANLTAVPDDSNYAASVSVPVSYTGTGPTAGAKVGDLDNRQIGCSAPATAGPNQDYQYHPDKPVSLRGVAQGVAINLGGAVTGGTITVSVKWTEVTTQ